MQTKITTYCGLDCNTCPYKQSHNCQGCTATGGHPFHGECELAQCARLNAVRFCGECAKFPCELLQRYSNDEEHGDTPKGARIERCKEIKAALVAEAREGKNPISYCGHHCDFCFLAQWCGGCRSEYNCCSFATLFEDSKCPNVTCAQSKGIEGCYICDELEECTKGYYGREDEYVCKATALFIKRYGQDAYTQTLQKAINDGVDYPKDFDKTGSVSGAMDILEKIYFNLK